MKSRKMTWTAMFLLAGMAIPMAHAAQCPDIKIVVRNGSQYPIVGGVWGNTGNLGSSGFSVSTHSVTTVGLYAQNYPQGDTFGVEGFVQGIIKPTGFVSVNLACGILIVPGINGCPDPKYHPHISIANAPAGTVQCTMFTGK